MVLLPSLLAVAASILPVALANPRTDPALLAALAAAPTRLDFHKLLNDTDYVFDFKARKAGERGTSTGPGGHSVNANSGNMPALLGENVSITVGYVGPCGLNSAHSHPRSAEFNYVQNGSFYTGHFNENGARTIVGEVKEGQATLFPLGAFHFEANLECQPSTFIAAFGDSDPGALQVAAGFFGLPSKMVGVELGGALSQDQIALVKRMIPANIALGLDECIKRCGFKVVNGTIQNPYSPNPRMARRVKGAGTSQRS